MAATGVLLFGFVFTHMAGNLKVYQGAEKFNEYAAWLRTVGTPVLPESGMLWIARAGLLAAIALHIAAAVKLTRQSMAARPRAYVRKNKVQLDYASRTMRWSGVIVFAFVVYHLLHMTLGTVHSDFVTHDPYHNVVAAFSVWPVSVFYILANLLLGTHLYHGLWSMFQTLGWNRPVVKKWRRPFAVAFAVVVTAGFVSVPLGVLTGIVG